MTHKPRDDKIAKPWAKVSEKVILNHPELIVTEDSVTLPNGKTSSYVRKASAEHHSVIMIVVNDKNQILIQREYSYPPNEVMWQLPGGSMKIGETILQSAKRELAEEAKLGAKSMKIIGYYYTNNRFSDQKQHVVVCEDLYTKHLPEDHDEFIETHWFTKEEIIQKITKKEINNINLLASLNLWLYI